MKYFKAKISSFTILLIISIITLCASCKRDTLENEENMPVIDDPHSYSNPAESRVTHLDWMAAIDFDHQVIDATATLTLENSPDADTLMLDTNLLTIHSAQLNDGSVADFSLGPMDKIMGQRLSIAIKPDTKYVTIKYSTSPGAAALQWLKPQQTAGKKLPFLFTQSEAILARSWVPIQDSPGVRFTYSAKVKVPPELIALMSASNPQEMQESGEYEFDMPQPIPSYLLALAVGDLRFASLGPRCGIYAEPSVIIKAANEFDDLKKMIAAAESLYGAYQWGRYDLLILPPSFPFGGMENPRLTFVTPTVIAGDRSLTSLVAHELAHSWSGNLVTNATWNDFWLNEGFTVYFEMRIMEKLYGRDYSEMLASLEVGELKDEINEMMSNGREEDTHLKLNLEGRNPDDGMNNVAYVKGYLFLRYLEKQAGRKRFDIFLKDYFERNAFKVMDTEGFIDQLMEYLINKERLNIGRVKIEEWIYGPGIPEDADFPVSDRFLKVDKEREKFLTGATAVNLETKKWSSHEWVYFLKGMSNPLSSEKMKDLDKQFSLTKTGNSEILTTWLILCVKNDYEPANERIKNFLIHTGRRKYLVPLYQAILNQDNGRQRALSIYEQARPNYHYVATNTLDELLKFKAGE